MAGVRIKERKKDDTKLNPHWVLLILGIISWPGTLILSMELGEGWSAYSAFFTLFVANVVLHWVTTLCYWIIAGRYLFNDQQPLPTGMVWPLSYYTATSTLTVFLYVV